MDSVSFPFGDLNNQDLFNLFQYNYHNFLLNVIDNMTYDPLRYIDSSDDFPTEYFNVPTCNYVFCDEPATPPSDNSLLSVLSYNISSLPLHFDGFIEECVNALNDRVDVFGFCETRLTDATCTLFIP